MPRRRIFKGKLPIIAQDIIEIDGVKITIQRKRIRNINLRIKIKTAEVFLSAPVYAAVSQITKFINERFEWIKQKRQEIIAHREKTATKSNLKFDDGEVHKFWGENHVLRIIAAKRSFVVVKENIIEMHCAKDLDVKQKKIIIEKFYRQELQKVIPSLIKKYEEIMQVSVKEFGVKKMKTRWGTCNFTKKRIWLNLELIHRNIACLEMIIVHEMVHLLESSHNKRFYRLMDKFLPNWQFFDKLLKEERIGI